MTSNPVRVVIADDDPSLRRLLAAVLSDEGFEVIQAEDGEEAIALIEHHHPDVAILDYKMPRLSGLDVIRRVRHHPELGSMQLLMFTGSDEVPERIAGLNAGADDYLAKGADHGELVARVRARVRAGRDVEREITRSLDVRSKTVSALASMPLPKQLNAAAAAICEQLVQSASVEGAVVVSRANSATAVIGAAGSLHDWTRSAPLLPSIDQGVHHGAWLDAEPRVLGVHGNVTGLIGWTTLPDPGGTIGLLGVISDRQAEPSAALAVALDCAPVVAALLRPEFTTSIGQGRKEDLLDLIELRRFTPVYQPVIELRTREVVGYEALTRFASGERPDLVFADADQFGLLVELERATLEAAIDGAEHLDPDAYLTLNASPTYISEGLSSALASRTDRDLVIELTEHKPVTDYDALARRLQSVGTKLSVDDTGAGYSSLRHILRLRPDFVKADRSWVENLDDDIVRQELFRVMRDFTHRIGSTLIAEGIETPDELDTLIHLGVQFGQGYLLGRPEPAP